MPDVEWEKHATKGLTFFGKMSASISHDIRNCLAIINEKAGLLDDLLSIAAGGGKPLEAEMVKDTAQAIMRQVRRADRIVVGLNRLAHSVDVPCCQVNLNETAELVTTFSQRLAAARKARLELALPESVIQVENSPFFLMHLLFYYIDMAVESATDGLVKVQVEDAPESGRIGISGHPEPSKALGALPHRIADLEKELGVTVGVASPGNRFVLEVPKAFRSKGLVK